MGRLDIPQISKGFFATVLPFRTEEGRKQFDYETFRRTIQEVLAAQEGAAGSRRIDPDVYRAARYAMVALVDELAIVSDWSYRNDWAQEPLELAIFDSNVAGEEFFDQLNQLKQKFNASRDEGERDTILGALEVFYTCLKAGFKGRYRGGGEGELNAVLAGLLGLLWPEAEGRSHRALFPEAYAEGGKSGHRGRHMNKWPLIVAGAFVLVFGLYLAYSFVLGGTARQTEKVIRNGADQAVSGVAKPSEAGK